MITLPKRTDPDSKNKKLSEEISKEFVEKEELETDPLGSWTGTPRDRCDVPTQDADDL